MNIFLLDSVDLVGILTSERQRGGGVGGGGKRDKERERAREYRQATRKQLESGDETFTF